MQEVLSDTGVPGAGLALVRMSGVEWAGGVGLADRDDNTPVTADTHFRAGSISKTFIASALVQLYLDDEIDLDTPVAEIAPEIRIDNAWEPADPVRVIHLLQHTAGFDDMHFNEMYNVSDPPDMPLEEVLQINPSSRVVRWQPGTRMSYSNPGYAVAGYLIEKVTGEKYEDRIAEKIFKPVGHADEQLRPDQGRRGDPREGLSRSHGPAGAVHADLPAARRQSPHLGARARPIGARAAELGRDGNRSRDRSRIPQQHGASADDARVVCGAAQRLRQRHRQLARSKAFRCSGTAAASTASSSSYAYSTSRDVGYVDPAELDALAATRCGASRSSRSATSRPMSSRRQSRKRRSPEATLRSYEGYYHDANPRNQAFAFIEWLMSGRTHHRQRRSPRGEAGVRHGR